MRPSALPKLVVAQRPEDMILDKSGDYADSPYSIISTHSRNSSTASDYSLTHTFSFQEHTRFSDSTSSLGTTPPKLETCSHKDSFESPRASKTTLGDLVEVPDEREDGFDHLSLTQSRCPCPPPFCIRQCYSASALERPSLDYSLADGFNSDHEAPLRLSKVRRGSGNASAGGLANRIGSRLPSLSRRVREQGPPASPIRQPSVRSAPTSRVPSRTSSFRLPSMNKPFIGHHDNIDSSVASPPGTPVGTVLEDKPQNELPPPLDIQMPLTEEPIDRKALASTPLLPTPLLERYGSECEEIQSPLQSPTVADSPVFPYCMSPATTPVLTATASPGVSPKHSLVSFGGARSSQMISSPESSFVEPLDAEDKWTARLGHANFIVQPAPYTPDVCDSASCKRLVEDWEEARKQFINQAARTSEHYGPTSQVYKLTEQKWTEIDALWRKNHEIAVEQAKKIERIRGESLHEARLPERDYQPLAEHAPLAKLPSLNDPNNTGKFPKLDEADIVGPMVQYAQITTQASKRTVFLKFFKDLRSPANTLGKSALGYRR